MSADIVVIIIFSIMGLAAHGARKQPWIEWTLRVIFSFAFVAELWTAFIVLPTRDGTEAVASAWSVGVTAVMATMTGLILFRPCRIGISYVLSAINDVVSGQLLYGAWWVKKQPIAIGPAFTSFEGGRGVDEREQLSANPAQPETETAGTSDAAECRGVDEREQLSANPAQPEAETAGTADAAECRGGGERVQLSVNPAHTEPHGIRTALVPVPALVGTASPIIGARSWKDYWLAQRVFVADSVPHLNGMWIYITVLGSLLANINLENFSAPMIGIPFPVPIDSLISYNFLGLILLAVCGCGIIVSRNPEETMTRLGLVKPAGWHVGVAILMVFVTAAYDFLWNPTGGGVGGKLSMYNAGTFATAGGGAGGAAFLAVMTGVCAGAGEEILMRGALQPVLGIVPAAILHGALHGQFQHAPILIIQVAGWSILMGIVRRYTNTTTTLITHATWNFITTFLFAFNP